MSDDCIFCKIAAGEIGTDLLHQDDHVVAFHDLNPQAPFHCLVIPRQHIASLDDFDDTHAELIGRLYLAARDIARAEGFAADGYRTVMNCGRDGGQTVFHIHLHVLAGRRLTWPPG